MRYKQFRKPMIFCLILITVVLSGCGDDKKNPVKPDGPILQMTPDTLDFERDETFLIFSISNIGTDTLNWVASSNQPWVTVIPDTGSTSTETDDIVVMIDRSGLQLGNKSVNIVVTSNGGGDTLLALVAKIEPFGAVYFPLEDGDTWYYTKTDSTPLIRTISGDTTVLGKTCKRVLHDNVFAEAWSVDDTGFNTHILTGDDVYTFVPPLFIPFSMATTRIYLYNSQFFVNGIGEGTISGHVLFVDYGTAQVPAGEFLSTAQLHFVPYGDTLTYDEYYAPNVGLLYNGDIMLDSAYVGGTWYRP